MTTMAATMDSPVRGRRWALFLAGGLTATAVGMVVVGALVTQWVAGGHGVFHALFAIAFLVPSLVLARRQPSGGAAATPVVLGFALLGMTQLVEGLGGFGFGPDNDTRVNALAQVHDLGLVLAPLGLIAGAGGVTLGVAQILRRRFGLLPALGLTAPLAAGLGLFVAKMVGM